MCHWHCCWSALTVAHIFTNQSISQSMSLLSSHSCSTKLGVSSGYIEEFTDRHFRESKAAVSMCPAILLNNIVPHAILGFSDNVKDKVCIPIYIGCVCIFIILVVGKLLNILGVGALRWYECNHSCDQINMFNSISMFSINYEVKEFCGVGPGL